MTIREFSQMVKMPVKGVPWGLINKVPQVLKFWSAQVPRVPECLKCPDALNARLP